MRRGDGDPIGVPIGRRLKHCPFQLRPADGSETVGVVASAAVELRACSAGDVAAPGHEDGPKAEAAAASTSVGQCALPPQDDVVATLPPPQREGADTLTIMPGGPAVDTVVADVPAGQPCAELPLAARIGSGFGGAKLGKRRWVSFGDVLQEADVGVARERSEVRSEGPPNKCSAMGAHGPKLDEHWCHGPRESTSLRRLAPVAPLESVWGVCSGRSI